MKPTTLYAELHRARLISPARFEGTHMSPVVYVQAGGSLPTVDRLREAARRRRGKR